MTGPSGGGRAVGPDRVDRVGLDRDERRAGRCAGLGELLGAVDGMQPRVVAERGAGREVLLDPALRRRLDQVLDREQRRIDLLARLQACSGRRRTAARGRMSTMATPAEPVKPVSQASRSSRRPAHIRSGARSARGTMKPVSPRARQFGAQRRDPRAARAAVRRDPRTTGSGLRTCGAIYGLRGAAATARSSARRRRSTSVTQPSSAMRRSKVRPRARYAASAALACAASSPDSTTCRRARRDRAIGVASRLQRREQDIGEHERERRALAEPPGREAARVHDLDEGAGAVEPRILARDLHRAGVDVARQHRRAQRARRRDGEHAGAGADVEHAQVCLAPAALLLHEPVEREQAAAGGAVVAGAEGERRLDLDADAVAGDARAVVRAVHHEAAGFDRGEALEARAHPVLRRQPLEGERVRRVRAGGEGDQRPHRGFVRRIAEMHGERPAPIRLPRTTRPPPLRPRSCR